MQLINRHLATRVIADSMRIHEWMLKNGKWKFHEKQRCFSSVAQLCLTLCNPMNGSTPGLPLYHQLPESTQTHVYRVSDAIQPSHPLSSPSPPALNLSQHQGLFKWVSSSHQVTKVLGVSVSASEYSGLISFRIDWLGCLTVQRILESSPTPQFKSINSSVLSLLYGPGLTSIHTWLLGKP